MFNMPYFTLYSEFSQAVKSWERLYSTNTRESLYWGTQSFIVVYQILKDKGWSWYGYERDRLDQT